MTVRSRYSQAIMRNEIMWIIVSQIATKGDVNKCPEARSAQYHVIVARIAKATPEVSPMNHAARAIGKK